MRLVALLVAILLSQASLAMQPHFTCSDSDFSTGKGKWFTIYVADISAKPLQWIIQANFPTQSEQKLKNVELFSCTSHKGLFAHWGKLNLVFIYQEANQTVVDIQLPQINTHGPSSKFKCRPELPPPEKR